MATANQTKTRRRMYERLTAAMERDRDTLAPFRNNRLKALKAFAGHHYSNGGADCEQPCNFIDLYVRAMVRSLVAKNPRFQLSTWIRRIEPVVDATQDWANKEAERLRFDVTFQRLVLDALFSIGIAQVALADPADANLRGWKVPAGAPFIDVISLDDWVVDTYADDFDAVAYEGHRTRVPLEAVLENKLYSREAREDLYAHEYAFLNEDGEGKASAIGVEQVGPHEELEDMVYLWSAYLPRTKRVLTLVGGPQGDLPGGDVPRIVLRDDEYFGPDEGRYHHLSYGLMPDNLMPPAPVQNLVFPNKVLNDLARKLVGQAGRQKTLAIGRLGAGDDAERVKRASDGEVILLSEPASISEFVYGGPNALNFQFFEAFRGLFDQLAGNLSTLLGLKSMSPTAKQEGLLDANASRTVADLAETTASFVSRVCRAWLWWEWNSPVRRMRTLKEGPMGLRELDRVRMTFPNRAEFRNDPRTRVMTRSAPFDALDVKIDPYSIRFTTPEQKANDLIGLFTQLIVPLVPILQAQGKTPDMDAFLKIVGRYKDMPELAKIMQMIDPPAEAGAEADSPPQPGGDKTYWRKSEGPGDGGSGVQNNPGAAMMAAQNQQGGGQ